MKLMSRIIGAGALASTAVLWIGCLGGAVGGPSAPSDPSQMSAPPTGQGVQMLTDAFVVKPGNEIQACYFFKVADLLKQGGMDNTKPVDVHRIQIVQKPGSHHMNLFRVRTITGLDPENGVVQVGDNGKGACFVSSNWSDWPLIANTQQQGDQDWSYPDGVANQIDPSEVLMLQTHYVNAATQQTSQGLGQVGINLWSMDPTAVQYQLGTVFATNQNIRICEKNPTPTFSHSCQFGGDAPVTIVGANGHFHSRGKEFDIYSWDGKSTTQPPDSDRFYQSLDWANPPMRHSPDLSVPVQAGGGFWWTCSFEWQDPAALTNNVDTCATLNAFDQKKYMTPASEQDCCYTFGPQVDINEHCNAFVYYYPKQDNVTCF
jgi:hypothetical protein